MKKFALLSALLLSTFFVVNTTAQDRPNIILMMADDLGWGDTGYNGHPFIKTPHLDQMANDGIRFDRFYSGSAVCSPTRASFLTGRSPYRTGVFTANRGILRQAEITIPEILKEQGYATGHFGKWHLGTFTHTERDANRAKPGNIRDYNPAQWHGNETVFATESKVPTYDPMLNPPKENAERQGERKPYGTSYWNEKGEKVTGNMSGDDSRVIIDRVLPFIEKSKKNKKPFVAVVWFHAPHKPCVAGPEYHEMYKDRSFALRNYAGCITAMDKQVGRLRAFLKEQGLDQNTMLTFCSDNGPENGPGLAGPYRERKRSLHEGGIRVPGLMVWPEKIKKGTVLKQPFVTYDYLPTILDALSIEMPEKRILDGTSILPFIANNKLKREKPISIMFSNQLTVQTNDHKLYARNQQYEFYNMAEDDLEKNNVIASYPELKAQLEKHFLAWEKGVQNTFEWGEYQRGKDVERKEKWVTPLKISRENKKLKGKKKDKKDKKGKKKKKKTEEV